MKTNTICYYCGLDKAVKNWPVTNEPVCLSCRLHFLGEEFEGTASKEDCDQVRYYGELMSLDVDTTITKFDEDEKGGEKE